MLYKKSNLYFLENYFLVLKFDENIKRKEELNFFLNKYSLDFIVGLKLLNTTNLLNFKDINAPIYNKNVYDIIEKLLDKYKPALYIFLCNGFFISTNIDSEFLCITYKEITLEENFFTNFFKKEDLFLHLNNAFCLEKIFLNFFKLKKKLVHIFDISRDVCKKLLINNKVFININENTSVEFIYVLVDKHKDVLIKNLNVNILLQENAVCKFVLFNYLKDDTVLLFNLKTIQRNFSIFLCFLFTIKGFFVRYVFLHKMAGDNITNRFNVICNGLTKQIYDIFYKIYFESSNCESFFNIQTLLKDNTKCFFLGYIEVNSFLENITAKMFCNGLLLAKNSFLNFKPQLNIKSKNVKCIHNAVISHVQEDKLFYLHSRGLSSCEAESLLLVSFLLHNLNVKDFSKTTIKELRNVIF